MTDRTAPIAYSRGPLEPTTVEVRQPSTTDVLEAAAIAPIFRFFDASHLPPRLQYTARPFSAIAMHLFETHGRRVANAELAVALRHLLDAKDAAVRAELLRADIDVPGR